MSSIIDANMPCASLVRHLSALSESKRRWRSAFVTIYCSRAFEKILTRKKSKISPISLDIVDIDIVKDYSSFYNVHQTSLTKLVKEKSLDQLNELGGVQGIATSLNSGVNHGINGDDEDILCRIEAFGSNRYLKPPRNGFFHFVWEAFKDPTIAILLVCAALSLGFGIKEHGPKEGWYDGGSIFVAIFLVISVSAISNFRQNRQFEKLSNISSNIPVEVVRNGRRQQISIFQIVVGDVVCLKIGDQVPADGVFLEGHSLRVDESSMTGESDHLEINHSRNPFLISGTNVADGYGQMLVTSVGMNTIWGEMMSTVSRDSNEKTPLQSRLNKLISAIGKVGLAVAFLVLVVLLVRYFTGHTEDANGNKEFNGSKTRVDDVINAVVEIIAAAVTIVVVAIPEGLPLAVTLTLAYSMKRMMADQAMVRKLSACETMGSATTICTDKTGTLTLNRMTVTDFWLGKDSIKKDSYISIATDVLKLLQQAVGLNTTGSVYKFPSSGTEGLEFSGSPTEKAILSWAVGELNMDMERVKRSYSILQVEAFNSEKKRSGVLMKKNADNSMHVHWKGAAEMILAMCSHYYGLEGEVTALDHFERKKFEEIIQGMAASSLRCIAFAHKKISEAKEENGELRQTLEDNNLILLGIVGLKDPCRPGVKKAVEDCQYAGVKIKMITGDDVFTATAIATECGILQPSHEANDGLVVEGVEFRNYTDEVRMKKVDKIVVMARSSPLDKHLMVKCLKAKGHVVAVTGDGTNDAPALKEADIGLSMGIQGTEVAKESSDIVILDDNFASVATVLSWGRCVYNNIQKFIQFQLTVNVAALVINFVAAISAGEVPLRAVQLLWVNLIMDTLGALALATGRPTKELMNKPPVGRTEPLITNIMWRNLLSQALYQIAVLLTLQFKGESIFHVSKKVNDTLIFNTFVLCQVFNEFNARKLERKNVFEGIHRNKLYLGIIGITIILQVVMVEFLKRFADTERLNWGQWGACIAIAAASWPIGWIVKCIPVPEKPLFSYLRIAAEKQKELLDNLIQSPSHTVINAIPSPACLTDLARQKKIEQFHQLGGVKGVASILKTDAEKGIQGDDEDIACRRHKYGSNTIQKPTPKTSHIVLETSRDPIIIILLVCATFSLVCGIIHSGLRGCSDGISIFVAIFLVIAVTARCKLWSRRQFFRLSEDRDNFHIFVLRDGQKQSISVFEAVAGDVIFLKCGDQVPADGLYIDGESLVMDESNITPNMILVEVHDSNPFLLSSTKVIHGYARMLVTAVGINTESGKKPSSKRFDSDQSSPLEMRLQELAKLIAKIGLAVSSLVLVVLLIRYFIGNMHDDHGNTDFIAGKTAIRKVFKAVIGIIATPLAIASTAIPEGLILAAMISIAYSIKSMAPQHAQIRNLSAFEAIGATTVICTDERGNLTVSEICFGGKHIEEGHSSSIPTNVLELLLEGALLKHTEVSSGSPIDSTDGEIESAIWNWGDRDTRLDVEQVRANCAIQLPETFHPEASQSVIWIKKKTDNSIHVHQKGEAEVILNMCSQYYDENGNIKDLPGNGRGNLMHIIQEMKSKGLRCIGFAHKNMSKEHGEENENLHPEFKEEGFTFIGLVGLKYQYRPQVRKAVEDCQQAKVDTKIVTRNDLPTAIATAIECGILETNGGTTTGEVIDGLEFQSYTEEKRLERSDKIRVMARASTLDKLLMVKCLQQKGHVVAVTGDTIGDATVLGEADVGLSLGTTGTQYAKENSDVIILDNNFDSIAKVLRWGRSMYHNIQVYAQFQFTVSIASLVIDSVTSVFAREPPTIDIVAAISSGSVPYATVQVLWIKLIVGMLAALAITIEEPAEELGQLPPVKRNQPFISNTMGRNIVGQALYPIIILLTIQFKGESTFNLNSRVKDTMIFNILVLWQLFLMFKLKKIEENFFEGIQRRKMFWAITGVIILFQVIIVELLKKFAHTEQLTWKQWIVCIGVAALAWPIGWLIERMRCSFVSR